MDLTRSTNNITCINNNYGLYEAMVGLRALSVCCSVQNMAIE